MLTACSGDTSIPDADTSQSAQSNEESAELPTETESSFSDKGSAESVSPDEQSEASLTPPPD